MNVTDLPAVNACLNAVSLLFLMSGYWFIRRKNKDAHRLCMMAAFGVSILFLGCYLYYHYHAGHVPFTGTGWVRPVYFFILITHIILAALVPVLAVLTIIRALKGNFEKHKKIARITYPVWVYVSVTGVVVYVMLYHLYPAS